VDVMVACILVQDFYEAFRFNNRADVGPCVVLFHKSCEVSGHLMIFAHLHVILHSDIVHLSHPEVPLSTHTHHNGSRSLPDTGLAKSTPFPFVLSNPPDSSY